MTIDYLFQIFYQHIKTDSVLTFAPASLYPINNNEAEIVFTEVALLIVSYYEACNGAEKCSTA